MADEEKNNKKRAVEELYSAVQKQSEAIPSDVTEYFLRRSGFQCDDPVVVKMVSVAAQKFLTDLTREAYAFSKKRTGAPSAQQKARRNVLLLDDVAKAAGKFGIAINKPEYFADTPVAGTAAEGSMASAGAAGVAKLPPGPAAVAAGEGKKMPSSSAASGPGRKKKK